MFTASLYNLAAFFETDLFPRIPRPPGATTQVLEYRWDTVENHSLNLACELGFLLVF